MPLRNLTAILLLLALLSTNGALAVVPVKDADSIHIQPASSHKKTSSPPLIEKYLLNGNLNDGEKAVQAELATRPTDDLRFQLGFVRFLKATERLAQDLYRFGLRDQAKHGFGRGVFGLPLPTNPQPETLTYKDARQIAQTFLQNLVLADEAMVPIKDPKVQLPLHFGMIRLDLNNDGRADEGETLWKIYAALTQNTKITDEQALQFYINFDRGDVHWFRGYSHLLAAVAEIYLAHDTQEMFDCTAHMFFSKVESPYPFLSKGKRVHNFSREDIDFLDVIALVHTIRWPVVEPQRMEAALHHLEFVPAQSKESWKWILAETDNDREWLPSPKQDCVIPDLHVSNEMVYSWSEMMRQVDEILAGKLLVPFWRGNDARGVNVRRVFLEPRTFDMVLWVQGAYAAPYLEEGQTVQDWRGLMREFRGHFPGFAAWFN